MPIRKKIIDQFVYLSYVREDHKDFIHFKRELENMLSLEIGNKDVVVDFTGSDGVTSSEIGLLVRLTNTFQKSARYVRIVGDEKVVNTLKSTNIQDLKNFMIYNNQQAFFDELKKLKHK